MRVRSTILAAALTVSVLGIGAGAAVADDHDRHNPPVEGYDHEGIKRTYDSVGGQLGIVWSTLDAHDNEGTGRYADKR
ncbi:MULTISPECIES: hypothetical protein [Streptomyces]|uniref:Uncharacterized protein n=2 Tax=Streptomyces TaxID=1883 RepID=A0A0W7X939_9ACTN|nr:MULTISPECIES: hypothetical protein [Streptomyces]KUF19313.1 hypothetical protein AT728_30290 [Streptomyces silvensis]MVO88569.1 hypothetical protein [Streptomyces typhae]